MAYCAWSEREGTQENIFAQPATWHSCLHLLAMPRTSRSNTGRSDERGRRSGSARDLHLPGLRLQYPDVSSIWRGGSKLMGILVIVALKHPPKQDQFRIADAPSNTLRPRPKFGRQIDIPLPLHGTKGMGMEGSGCQRYPEVCCRVHALLLTKKSPNLEVLHPGGSPLSCVTRVTFSSSIITGIGLWKDPLSDLPCAADWLKSPEVSDANSASLQCASALAMLSLSKPRNQEHGSLYMYVNW